MRQHMKAKTNNVKSRSEAPTRHQVLIATRVTAAKQKLTVAKAEAAARKAARQPAGAPVATGSKQERFADRAARRSVKWAHFSIE